MRIYLFTATPSGLFGEPAAPTVLDKPMAAARRRTDATKTFTVLDLSEPIILDRASLRGVSAALGRLPLYAGLRERAVESAASLM